MTAARSRFSRPTDPIPMDQHLAGLELGRHNRERLYQAPPPVSSGALLAVALFALAFVVILWGGG